MHLFLSKMITHWFKHHYLVKLELQRMKMEWSQHNRKRSCESYNQTQFRDWLWACMVWEEILIALSSIFCSIGKFDIGFSLCLDFGLRFFHVSLIAYVYYCSFLLTELILHLYPLVSRVVVE